MMKRFALAIVLVAALVGSARAGDEGVAAGGGATTSPATAPAPDKVKQYLDIAEGIAPSFVRVEYTMRYDKGEAPRGGSYGGDGEYYIRQERPLEKAGFLIEPNKVLTGDILMHPRFIESIHVRFGDEVVGAKVCAYATQQSAVFLELEKPLAKAKPLVLDGTKKGPYLTVSYRLLDGEWNLAVSPATVAVAFSETGKKAAFSAFEHLYVDSKGVPVGISMTEKSDADESWKTEPSKWPSCSDKQMADLLKSTEAAADSGLPRVTLGFRSPKKDSGSSRRGRDEEHVVGVVLDNDMLLVLADLKPNVTARLEHIVVHGKDKDVTAKFVGTLSDYGGFVAKLDSPMSPMGFSTIDLAKAARTLLMSAEITLQGERRVVYYMHNRINGYNLGWKRRLYPEMAGGATFVLDPQGKLLALPIAKREKTDGGDRYGRGGDELTLTPVAYIKETLDNLAKNSDPSNTPLAADDESRIAWLGVILQPLGSELARAKNVSDMTNDGATGAIVSYVYPDSPADKQGIKADAILLRINVEGQPKPLEVQGDPPPWGGRAIPWDDWDQLPEQYFDGSLPTPWPTVQTALNKALTYVGFGKKFTADFFIDGKVVKKDFVVTQSPAHYESAARYKFSPLGLTVKDLTYEARVYLLKGPKDPGVLIFKIEPGSKSAVGGLRPFELITHVNETPVNNVTDFEKAIKQASGEVKFSVIRMNKGRTVKVSLAGAAPAATSGPATKSAKEDDEAQPVDPQ
jgi:S1-C subfamily serine protease